MRKLATWWLHVPERWLDILSIVFISTGVNVITNAASSSSRIIAISSGVAILASGFLVAELRSRAQAIAHKVSKMVKMDASHPNRTPRSTSQHRSEVISKQLSIAKKVREICLRLSIASVLAAGGMTGWFFWSLLGSGSTENRALHVEVATVSARIDSLMMEFARASSDVAANLEQLSASQRLHASAIDSTLASHLNSMNVLDTQILEEMARLRN